MPKRVYLDSSDFSNLSVPEQKLTQEHRAVLATLREHKRAGRATYFMSPVHLSEAVHAAESHKEAAVRRAELMRELCSSNILRLPTDLPELELKKVLAGQDPQLSTDEIKSHRGEWFGANISLEDMPSQRENARREIMGLLDKLPRRERRKRRSELDFRKKSSHEKWRELLNRGSRLSPVPYPFSLLNQDIVAGWLLGEISDLEFRQQALQIAHDPYIMFKYFLENKDSRERLYNSLRAAGDRLMDESDDKQFISALAPFAKSKIHPHLAAMARDFFSQPNTLRRVTSLFNVNMDSISDRNLPKVIEACPSLFTFVGVNKSRLASTALSYLSRIQVGNMSVKSRKASDLGDIMHSCYAPYFDIFRCDASFGAHLKSHKPIRTKIASRMGELSRMLSDVSTDSTRDVA